MEQDLIAIAARLLDGPAETVDTVTSGGTESILLAVQTARDARPDVAQPNMVLPSSAHGAFHKAAHYFGARTTFVPVDACIGGCLLPYLRRGDPEIPAFSFLVPGVTSISVDLHKYAYTPKGASILLHRNPELRRAQFFATTG
jgi:glutamate/tyrosine decarboxylase-like PLP-dependent enzyme